MKVLVVTDTRNDFATGLLGTPEGRRSVLESLRRRQSAADNG